ncbi:disulfide bond formation protein DsbB [Candidatus Rickettsiella isopodorum]|jgi:protein dithiol:quinone oxidoreductase|uniref:Disulfide bond formation protein B n=1 Tax=Candidatus Rickettsiella isopodorum TaxID=1225476 RepID=A0A1J8NH48_9COXI|nr:disulfide bond formation protein B [Candidatus Rickettsiella isopodorum]MCH9637604.1 disulfide bond formation protein B [Gammaproteobacteria bacterium]MDQ5899982.1 Disulfide bond formation protein [Pseudomonadota bacterium]MCH9754577.1 disulfide bond formation protein B [Gammaproteobacteria bacterium]MDD5161644.1 disulfide bond formation protein B [Candidatus Rickettsiella isopodorum]OIZ94234.1 disulfide bond formation protein DsbB [Candidatus Rickettsiella isopodorum]
MHLPVTRWIDLLTFFLCALVLAIAAYLQYKVGIIPCPLCIIQRFLITLLGLLFLMGGLFNFEPVTRCFLHTLTFLFAVAGAVVASRQLWLEHFPSDQLISCQATIAQYSTSIYFHKIIALFFQGTSNCGSGTWRFLNLSMPGWTLIIFIVLAAISLRQVYINRRKHKQHFLS